MTEKPISDPADLEIAIANHCCSYPRMTRDEITEFLLAVLTAIVVGEHLTDPDQGDAVALARRVVGGWRAQGGVRWPISTLALLIANNEGAIR